MYRVTRLNDYVLLSASKLQVAEQSVLECRPIVLEPPKQFFSEYIGGYAAPSWCLTSSRCTRL